MNGKITGDDRSLERRLAELDPSAESRVRESLGRELAHRVMAESRRSRKDVHMPRRLSMFRRPVPAFALGAVVALAALTLAHPDGRAALASLGDVFNVGENTHIFAGLSFEGAALDSILADHDENVESGRTWYLDNDYGGWGGGVPPGADPFIRQTGSLSLAAQQVAGPLLVPTHFHERVPARLRFRQAQIMPDGMVLLTFGVGPYETVLSRFPVGDGRAFGMGTTTMTVTENGRTVEESNLPAIEEITRGDRKIVWIVHDEGTRNNLGTWARKRTDTPIGKFVWEEDGVSYSLNGRFLTRDEGLRIIESLRPVGGER